MMLHFEYFLKKKFFKILIIILITISISNSLQFKSKSRYTFNKFNMNTNSNSSNKSTSKEKTNMQALIKNYAMNMADTQLLKIDSNSFSNSHTNSYNDNFTNKEQNIFTGSVLISDKNQLSFSADFLELDDNMKLKGRRLIARAKYTKSLSQIGWSRLYVETFDHTSSEIQSWAAGFLEGKLCAKEILDFYKNLVGIHSKETTYLKDVFDYYHKVEKSIRYRTSKPVLANVNQGKELEYWISVAMIQAQTDGLLAGYNSIMKDQQFNFAQIYFLNADGEVPELLSVFKYKKEKRNFNEYSFKETTTKMGKEIITETNSPHTYSKFSPEYLQHYFGTTDANLVWDKLMTQSHCSAIIKIVKGENNKIDDVLIGHTTWDSYSEMHRIFKMYKFSYTMYGEDKKNSIISFSSYPGTLTSTDDYYLLNNKIVVMETTLEMLDRTLYETKIPVAEEHVPNYIRISVANRLAATGREWVEIFKQNNGGTYNSQWMVLDFSKFENIDYVDAIDKIDKIDKINNNNRAHNVDDVKRKERSLFNTISNNNADKFNNNNSDKPEETLSSYIKNPTFNFKQEQVFNKPNHLTTDFFIVLEQIPGYIEIKDMTQYLLLKGFWGSYNRPYFEKISKDAGYYDMLRQYGRTYSYEDNPRAQIINKLIRTVNDINALKDLMQMNRNLEDTDYINSISPRYDLASNNELRKAAGGIDTKIVSYDLVKEQSVIAISGPSTLGGAAPFRWSSFPDEPHYGLPEYWNFDWKKFDENFIKN